METKKACEREKGTMSTVAVSPVGICCSSMVNFGRCRAYMLSAVLLRMPRNVKTPGILSVCPDMNLAGLCAKPWLTMKYTVLNQVFSAGCIALCVCIRQVWGQAQNGRQKLQPLVGNALGGGGRVVQSTLPE